MKSYLYPVLILLALLSLSGCKLFKQPTLEKIHDVKIVKFGVDKIDLDISISIHNPNSYQLKLDKLNVELLNKDRGKIGAAAMQNTVIIPKRSSNALNFRVSLDTRPTAKMISLSNRSVYFYINGKGHGTVLGFGKNFDFEKPYELDLSKHLQELIPRFEAGGENIFKLKRSYFSELGFAQSELAIDFLLLNPFGLTFKLKGFPAEVWLGDTKVGSGNLSSQMGFTDEIHSKDGSMRFQISNLKAVWTALKGAFKGEIAYTVKGTVIIDAFGMEIRKPYQYSGSVPVSLTEKIIDQLK